MISLRHGRSLRSSGKFGSHMQGLVIATSTSKGGGGRSSILSIPVLSPCSLVLAGHHQLEYLEFHVQNIPRRYSLCLNNMWNELWIHSWPHSVKIMGKVVSCRQHLLMLVCKFNRWCQGKEGHLQSLTPLGSEFSRNGSSTGMIISRPGQNLSRVCRTVFSGRIHMLANIG